MFHFLPLQTVTSVLIGRALHYVDTLCCISITIQANKIWAYILVKKIHIWRKKRDPVFSPVHGNPGPPAGVFRLIDSVLIFRVY